MHAVQHLLELGGMHGAKQLLGLAGCIRCSSCWSWPEANRAAVAGVCGLYTVQRWLRLTRCLQLSSGDAAKMHSVQQMLVLAGCILCSTGVVGMMQCSSCWSWYYAYRAAVGAAGRMQTVPLCQC